MPSDPSFDDGADGEDSIVPVVGAGEETGTACGETLSRNVTVGTKNKFPVTAVLKSRMRS